MNRKVGDKFMINEYDIDLYRGNTLQTQIQVYKEDGTLYELGQYDKLYFAVKASPDSYDYLGEDFIIKKIITYHDYNQESSSYILSLTSDETNIPSGVYFYSIGLRYDGLFFETIIPPLESGSIGVFRVRGTPVTIDME